ncbi:MAG: hypothetical protein H0W89_02640 [Candidatus Levybacteria bacterium]|nr:hypothetical protein [Candidatus Levybacteria bacterium]
MYITNIKYTKEANGVIVSAAITFRGKKTEQAYISVDNKYENFVAKDASPFLAAVLLPCMKTGENISVDGSVSKQLLENMNRIQKLILSWKIGFSAIEIKATQIVPDVHTPKHTASFFTAGVDSFYTYLHNRDKKETKISHLILVHGFDIPLTNEPFFKQVRETVELVAKEEKIEAIILKTNIGEIIEKRLIWDFAHGGALAAIALFLRRELKQVLIPGAVRNDQLFPYGTHPDLDPLWSTETVSINSDGGEHDRIGKITTLVSTSPLALQYLRVCTQNIKGKYNCSRCFKCLMTMFYLQGSDALVKAKTFDHTIDLQAVRNMYYDYKLKYNIQGEQALALLGKNGQNAQLQEAIAYSLEKSKHPSITKRAYQKIAAYDQKYNDRRLYQFVFQMNNGDRNILFKYLFKKGILK